MRRTFIYRLVIATIILCSFHEKNGSTLFPEMAAYVDAKPILTKEVDSPIFLEKDVQKFCIYYNNTPIKYDNENVFEISFGAKGIKNEYIGITNDSLYLYKKISLDSFLLKKEYLLSLNEDTSNDTIFIQKFGVINYHLLWKSSISYNQRLQDTVYLYKLKFSNKWKNEIFEIPSHPATIRFDEIALSREKGIISVSYRDNGYKVKYRYW